MNFCPRKIRSILYVNLIRTSLPHNCADFPLSVSPWIQIQNTVSKRFDWPIHIQVPLNRTATSKDDLKWIFNEM